MKTPTLYLLSGNGSLAEWWKYSLPHFTSFNPVPLELPGFGNNQSTPCDSLESLADALLKATEPGNAIVACGVNCLTVLHAAVKQPNHFKKIILYGPIGAFLWQRQLPKLLAFAPAQIIIKFLLGHFPKLFKRAFATRPWPNEHFALVAEGYRRCRSFGHYFNWVKPHNALTLFDTIEKEVDVIWGLKDKIADPHHAAAWEAILPRTKLRFSFHKNWGHYPYFEAPAEFVNLLEGRDDDFSAHTKAGRLRLAKVAGLPLPCNRRST
jgi:pimeloyl-ACP methyl ester carboxylesterase